MGLENNCTAYPLTTGWWYIYREVDAHKGCIKVEKNKDGKLIHAEWANSDFGDWKWWKIPEYEKLQNIRPEILAFAEAMEKMIVECPELKDWKTIDTEALKEMLYDHIFYNLVEEDDVNADSYVHLAGFAWMLWWRAKDELDKQD